MVRLLLCFVSTHDPMLFLFLNYLILLDVIDLVKSVVTRGANVQVGNVLRELSLAYEFAIGLGHFADDFVNPALLAKSSLKQARTKLTNGRGTRVLSEAELAEFLQLLSGSAYTSTIKNVLRLTL